MTIASFDRCWKTIKYEGVPKNHQQTINHKRRIIVNDKKGCTQIAYVGSLITMLVLHDLEEDLISFTNDILHLQNAGLF